jgi:hypothetical protein
VRKGRPAHGEHAEAVVPDLEEPFLAVEPKGDAFNDLSRQLFETEQPHLSSRKVSGAGLLPLGMFDWQAAKKMDAVAEVELLRCGYAARCARRGCRQYRATTIVRYLDHRDHQLRQLEVCDEHARVVLKREQRSGAKVRDLRGTQ